MIGLILQKILDFLCKKGISNVIVSTGVGTAVLQGWTWGPGEGGTSAVLTLDEKGGRLGWNASLLSRSAPCQNNMFWEEGNIYLFWTNYIFVCYFIK